MKFSKADQQGQTLLIMVLLLSLIITVVVATSYRLTSETALTEVQEQSIQVLAAADTGIEKALSLAPSDSAVIQTFDDLGLAIDGIDSQNSRILINPTSGTTFVSPLVTKDQQFTFHLSDYPNYTSFYDTTLDIYFDSEGPTACGTRTTPALEITVFYDTDKVLRWVAEPCAADPYIHSTGGANDLTLISGSFPLSFDGENYTFTYHTTNPIDFSTITEPKILFVRSLFGTTRVGFVGGAQIPSQGRTIRSEAYSTNGVSRIVSLYESQPQLPSDVFVTTF
ncbi:hypothetical protein KC726_02830 [Candidatus Woesebacteria bacterium]|nr:hypothetical protein [Candidatus Woesebacteria bacterium]